MPSLLTSPVGRSWRVATALVALLGLAVGAAVWLSLGTGSLPGRLAGPLTRHTAATGDAPGCSGVRRADVRGRAPSYVARRTPLARFVNDDAMCRGLWLPTADRWFVPQGLQVQGRTAWVSGYRWHRGYSARACRLLHISLRTGRLLARTDLIQARVYGPHLTFCRHGGALAQDRHGLWIVESNRLWLVNPERVGHADQVRRVWRLAPAVRGSVLVDGSSAELGIGTWHDRTPGRMHWFGYRDLLASGVRELVAGHGGAHQAGAVRTSGVVRRVQGVDRRPGRHAGAGLWSTASTSTCGMLVSPRGRRIAFAPGAEEIDFDGRGHLWAVLESGSRNYQHDGRPLLPMLARFDVPQLQRGPGETCTW